MRKLISYHCCVLMPLFTLCADYFLLVITTSLVYVMRGVVAKERRRCWINIWKYQVSSYIQKKINKASKALIRAWSVWFCSRRTCWLEARYYH